MSIGQVTRWLSGGTPNRSVPIYWSGNIPWISASTLKGSEISESDQHLTYEAVALGSKMAPVGATLLLVRGSALYNEIRAGLVVAPVCFNQDVKALVPAPKLEPRFLTYSLLGREADLLKLVSTAGNSAGVLDTKLVQAFEILLPSLPEQRAIAEALSDVDGLLGALEALIAKKRAIKQAAMQQLLTGKTRLPGFSGEWETKRLGDIAEIQMGRTPSRSKSALWGRGHVWLSIGDLHGKVVCESKEQITDLAAASMTPVPKGTLLMSFKLSIGRLCFAGCDLFTNEAICSFAEVKADADFLYYALSRTDFSLYGKQAVKGYTLNSASLRLVEVRMPELPEQSAIATVLSDMDAEIAALEARRDKTRAIKQGMMQQLLTGRVRLLEPAHVSGQAGTEVT